MPLRGALIAEGESDRGLIGVLERLCLREGVEVEIEWARTILELYAAGTSLSAKIRTLTDVAPRYDLLFVHRDADSEDPEARRAEIAAACAQSTTTHIAVVPIQETEAWLLVSEAAIRAEVGHPQGKAPLELPKISRIEQTKRPKETLREVLRIAMKRSPSKLPKAMFGVFRANLLESLDIDGPINHLSAWQALVDDTRAALTELRLSTPTTLT